MVAFKITLKDESTMESSINVFSSIEDAEKFYREQLGDDFVSIEETGVTKEEFMEKIKQGEKRC